MKKTKKEYYKTFRMILTMIVVALVLSALSACGQEEKDMTLQYKEFDEEKASPEDATPSATETVVPTKKAAVTLTPTKKPEKTLSPSVTVTPSSGVTVTKVPVTTKAATATPTPSPTITPAPKYTYTEMNTTMYALKWMNVRNEPSAAGEIISEFRVGDEVKVVGKCNETGWYRLELSDGKEGFCAGNLLSESKPETQSDSNSETGNSSSSVHQSDSEPEPEPEPESVTWVSYEHDDRPTGASKNICGMVFSEYESIYYDLYSDGSKDVYFSETYYVQTGGEYSEQKCLEYAKQLYAENKSIYNRGLELVNELRADAGSAPLVLDETLCIVATMRCLEQDLVTGLSHDRPDGSSCFTIIDLYPDYPYFFCGENVAWGQWDIDSAVSSWKSSQGHYDNMVNPYFSRIGIGFSNINGNYWTQDFAS